MAGLLTLAIMVVAATAFGYSILRPTARAASGSPQSSAFFVVDLLSLSVMLAIPFTFYGAVRRNNHPQQTEAGDLLAVILAGVFAFIWWRGTMTMSQIGISHSVRRCLYVGVLMPIAVVGSAIGVPLLIAAIWSVDRMSSGWLTVWLSGLVAAPVVAICCRRASLWILTDARCHSHPDATESADLVAGSSE